MSKKPDPRYGEFAGDVSEILFSEEAIHQRIAEIGGCITRDYAGKNLLMVGVLKGVLFFMADLLRTITMPVDMDFLAISSYSGETRSQGYVRFEKDLEVPIQDRHILFVEDVIDTGFTLNYVLHNLRSRQPASLEVCVLFDKPAKRLINVPLKYKGFTLPDQYAVGYGLDYKGKYRNLPFVGLLKAQVLHAQTTNLRMEG